MHKQDLLSIVRSCFPVQLERNTRIAECKGAIQASDADLFCAASQKGCPGTMMIDRPTYLSWRLQILVFGLDGIQRFIPKHLGGGALGCDAF